MNTVDALADELLDVMLDSYPLAATLMGMRGPRDSLLTDFSEAGEVAQAERASEIADRASALVTAELTPQERITRAVLSQQVEDMKTTALAKLTEFSVSDSISGAIPELLAMVPMVTIADADQSEAYLARLAAMPALLTVLADRHRAGIAAGRLPVRHLVDGAIAHLDRYLASVDDPLRRPAPDEDAAVDRDAFVAQRNQTITDVVRPAIIAYRDTLQAEIAPYGRDAEHAGLSFVPGGDDIYRRLIRMHTTTDRSADDLHRTGLETIAALSEEYREIGGRAFGTGELSEIFARLRSDESLRWRDAEELLTAARSAIVRAQERAPSWFGHLPGQNCEIQAVPDDEAPGAPGAYYFPPAMDGSRAGIYFANTYKAEERDRHTCEATAFHEGVPGHHFQLTIAQELTDLPMLRRIAGCTAYAEGWGLYAERLADEMGLYSNDIARLGMLANDSLRAARLVVDTGLHAKGWSREQAVRYMTDWTPAPSVEIESEVDRYIAMPGQALAYMVGRLEIQRIRAEAERALGPRFDIRRFHDIVLGGGALPLALLDDVVKEWVAGILAA
jgi:uncharacterized protein (DUF885 family)